MNALTTWNVCTEEKLIAILKGKFKALLVRGAQNNKYSVVNREIIFSKIENLGNILEKIGEAFLCNIEMNSAPTYLNLAHTVCLNVSITEEDITAISLQTTVCGLLKGESMSISQDLALSSEGEDGPMSPNKCFEMCKSETISMSENENSSHFSPNSDDELAKYLYSDVTSNANIKKEPIEDPDFSPPKIMKEEKKESSNRKRKRDGHESKSRHKKKRSPDENTRNMEECLKIVANLEDLDMKESNMALLTEHLDKNSRGKMKSTMELMEENIPKIYDTFKVICKFTISLKKMLNHIPFKLDEKTGEPIILCGGCHLHCWKLEPPQPHRKTPKGIPATAKEMNTIIENCVY